MGKKTPICGHHFFEESCQDCKALERYWYDLLKRKPHNFKDIEESKSPNKLKLWDPKTRQWQVVRLERQLKSWHDSKFKQIDIVQFKATEEYFRIARGMIYTFQFESALEKRIWELHSEGKSRRFIAEAIKNRKKKCRQAWVGELIKKIANGMGITPPEEIEDEQGNNETV